MPKYSQRSASLPRRSGNATVSSCTAAIALIDRDGKLPYAKVFRRKVGTVNPNDVVPRTRVRRAGRAAHARYLRNQGMQQFACGNVMHPLRRGTAIDMNQRLMLVFERLSGAHAPSRFDGPVAFLRDLNPWFRSRLPHIAEFIPRLPVYRSVRSVSYLCCSSDVRRSGIRYRTMAHAASANV